MTLGTMVMVRMRYFSFISPIPQYAISQNVFRVKKASQL